MIDDILSSVTFLSASVIYVSVSVAMFSLIDDVCILVGERCMCRSTIGFFSMKILF